MLRDLIAWVLNNYLGKYVENLNTTQLTVALLSGELKIKKTSSDESLVAIQLIYSYFNVTTSQFVTFRAKALEVRVQVAL